MAAVQMASRGKQDRALSGSGRQIMAMIRCEGRHCSKQQWFEFKYTLDRDKKRRPLLNTLKLLNWSSSTMALPPPPSPPPPPPLPVEEIGGIKILCVQIHLAGVKCIETRTFLLHTKQLAKVFQLCYLHAPQTTVFTIFGLHGAGVEIDLIVVRIVVGHVLIAESSDVEATFATFGPHLVIDLTDIATFSNYGGQIGGRKTALNKYQKKKY